MKRILFFALALLAFSGLAEAQSPPAPLPYSVAYSNMVQGNSFCIDLTGKPITSHNFLSQVFAGPSAVSAITITITGSTNGKTFSTVTTSTNTAGESISFTGDYTALCFIVSTLTGSGATVTGSYNGPALGGGGSVTGSVSITGTPTVIGNGTAGSADTHPLTVQGIASMTPIAIAYSNGGAIASTDVAPVGGNSSGTTAQYKNCDVPILYDTNTNGKTTLIALSSGKVIYVCGVSIVNSTTSAVTVSLGSGTGSNCATTYTAKTPAYVLPAQSSAIVQGIVLPNSPIPWMFTSASENLCAQTSAGVSVQIIGMATQF